MVLSKTPINPLPSSVSSSSPSSSSPSSSPFPSQFTESTQKSLGVYVHISTTNEGEHSRSGRGITVTTPPIEAYSNYRSVTGRLERLKFESDGKVRTDLRKLMRRILWIRRRLLRRDISDDERSSLTSELQSLLQMSSKLLSLVSHRTALYGDRFVVDVPEGYVKLCRSIGINPSDVDISIFVSSAVVDLEFEDSSRSSTKLAYVDRIFAGKRHPAKGLYKGSQEAKRVVGDLLILQEFLDGLLLSYHKGDYVTSNSLLPVRAFVLTLPKEVSLYIWQQWQFGDKSAFKLFKRVSAEAVKEFLWYLAQKNSVPAGKSHLLPGFVQNVHVTGDNDPFTPHYHSHFLVSFAVYDKRSKNWYRLNPLLDEDDIQMLRDIWKSKVIEAFGEVLCGDTLSKEFNVYVGDRYYSLPSDYVDVLFEMRYNARKMFVNYANYYERNPFTEDFDAEFVKYVFKYENRTERYGYLTNLKRYLSSISVATLQKRREELLESLEIAEGDLIGVDPDKFPLMYKAIQERIEALRKEIDRLGSLIRDPKSAFDALYKEVKAGVDRLLSRERVREERIVNILQGLFAKRVIGYKFVPLERNVPLHQFLEGVRSLVVLSDRHKTIEFMLFHNPYWEDPPDVEEIVIPRNF